MRVRSKVMMVIQKCAYTHFNVRNVIIKHISLSYTFVRIAINIPTERSLEMSDTRAVFDRLIYGICITSYMFQLFKFSFNKDSELLGIWPLF